MAFPKSLRSIEIEQKCSYGFTKDFVEKLLETHRQSIRQYAWICHNKENDDHIHLMLWFYNPQPTDGLLKWIDGVGTVSQLEKIKKDESALAYLTHANRPEKVQYDESEVHTNISNFKAISERARKLSNIQPTIDGIIDGSIRENDFFKLENADIYLKHKRKIDEAFEFRYSCIRKEVLSMEKDIDVIFVDGDSRTGKSSYIIEQCKMLGVSYCKSSSSNDFLQDYKDEEVLILDDMRDDALKLSDFLKFADPHYRSTTQSRYHNKCFCGCLIYITTTKPLERWYENCKEEQILQFTSRITSHIHFTKDDIFIYRHKDEIDTNDFVLQMCVPNLMKEKYKESRDKANSLTNKLLQALVSQAPLDVEDTNGFISADGGVVPFD